MDLLEKNKLQRKARQQERTLRKDSLSLSNLQQVANKKAKLDLQWSLDLSSEDFSRTLFTLFVEHVRNNPRNSAPITQELAAIDAEKKREDFFKLHNLSTQLNFIRLMAQSKEKNKAMWETESKFLKLVFPDDKSMSTLLDELINHIEQYEVQLDNYNKNYAELLSQPKFQTFEYDLNELRTELANTKSHRGFLARLSLVTAAIPITLATTMSTVGLMAATGLLSATTLTSIVLPITIPLLALTALMASITLIALTFYAIKSRQLSKTETKMRECTDALYAKKTQVGFFAQSNETLRYKLDNELQMVEAVISSKLDSMSACASNNIFQPEPEVVLNNTAGRTPLFQVPKIEEISENIKTINAFP